MTYLASQSSRRQESVRTPFVAGVLLAVLAAGVYVLWPHFYPALFMTVARPFWRAEFSAESGSLQSADALLRANEDLKRQLADAQVRTESVTALMQENEDLKAELGRASTTPRVLAAVLEKPPAALADELSIDAGFDHGFKEGNLVYAPGGVLVGRITSVLGETSTVTLFSSPGQKYDVEIGPTHAPATALGDGGGQYEAELPRTVPVANGDPVLVPSIESIPFASVVSVVSDPSAPFEKILFAPPVNIYGLRWVFVDTHVTFIPALPKIPPLEATKDGK